MLKDYTVVDICHVWIFLKKPRKLQALFFFWKKADKNAKTKMQFLILSFEN